MKLTYVSPSVVTLTGYTAEETISRPFDDWMTPESRELVLAALSSTVAKAKLGIDIPPGSRTAMLEMRKKDGGTVWAEVKVDFIRDAEGTLAGLLGVARDITDRRIAEMELERRAQLEMLITQISTAFIGVSTDKIDEGIQNALGSISLFCEVDRSYIFMFNEDKTSIVHDA